MKMLLTAALLLAALAAPPVAASTQKKWKTKEKRFEPVVRADARDYAGRYVGIDDSYVLVVEPAEGGLKVTSLEGGRRAEVRGLRLDGARLSGTKVYEDGSTAELDATFAERVLNGERAFGVVVRGLDIRVGDVTVTRTFYRQFTRAQRN